MRKKFSAYGGGRPEAINTVEAVKNKIEALKEEQESIKNANTLRDRKSYNYKMSSRRIFAIYKEINELEIQLKAGGVELLQGVTVTNILKKAGFEKMKSYTTAVKGWHEYSGEFQVSPDGEYLQVTWNFRRPNRDRIAKMLEVLVGAYGVERVDRKDLTVIKIRRY